MRAITRFLREQHAATSVEYAVILALILVTIIAAIGAVGAKSGGMWGGIANSVSSMNGGP